MTEVILSDLSPFRRRPSENVSAMQEIPHTPGLSRVCICFIFHIPSQLATVEQYPPRQYFVLTDAGKPVFVR